MPYGMMPSFIGSAMGGQEMPGSTASPVTPLPQNVASDYASGLLGLGPMEYDSQGRYGITEDQNKQAQLGALRQILTGVTQSLLASDPRYIANAAAAAGDTYQERLDKSSALNVANRTMQFQEARAKLELASGLNQLEKDKLAIEDVKRRAEEDEELRVMSFDVTNAVIKDVEAQSAEEVKAGTMSSEKRAELLAKARYGAALLRAGKGSDANQYFTEAYQDMPAHMASQIAEGLNTGLYARKIFEEKNAGWTLDERGNPIEKSRLEKAEKLDDLRLRGAELDVAIGGVRLKAANKELAEGPKPDRDSTKRVVELRGLANNLSGLFSSDARIGSPGYAEHRESTTKALDQFREISGLPNEVSEPVIKHLVSKGGPQAVGMLLVGLDQNDPMAITFLNQLVEQLSATPAPGATTRNPVR